MKCRRHAEETHVPVAAWRGSEVNEVVRQSTHCANKWL